MLDSKNKTGVIHSCSPQGHPGSGGCRRQSIKRLIITCAEHGNGGRRLNGLAESGCHPCRRVS